jgi:hypothetical protein
MSAVVLTVEAIEAGAKAQYEDNTGHKWGSKPEFMNIWRHHAFVVLNAAWPFMKRRSTSISEPPSEAEIEELTEIIVKSQVETTNNTPHVTAHSILTEGYRKPDAPRTVSTVEELDALPLLSVVISSGEDPYAWQKRKNGTSGRDVWYFTTDTDLGLESYYILEHGDAQVLWEPPSH